MDDGTKPFEKKAVWDFPTRLFHWALAACVLSGWYYGYYRDFTTITWHMYIGYGTIGLLVFRLLWGFFGPRPARFKSFFPWPGATISYAKTFFKREPSGEAGHSPMGALSVFAFLILLTVQVTTGLFAEDDGLFSSGPFSSYAEANTVLLANAIHYYVSRILFVLIGLHVVVIAFYYLWKKENLLIAMITGRKIVRK